MYLENKLTCGIMTVMIGREAYKNPWIFNKDLKYENIEEKKQIIFLYLNFLKRYF